MNLTPLYHFLSKNSFLLPLSVIGLTLATLFLTLLPSEALGESRLWSYDKLGHTLLFGSWTYLLGLYQYINRSTAISLWSIFLIGISFGLLIEILQHFLPLGRYGSIPDLFFDGLGCLLAVLLLKMTIPGK